MKCSGPLASVSPGSAIQGFECTYPNLVQAEIGDGPNSHRLVSFPRRQFSPRYAEVARGVLFGGCTDSTSLDAVLTVATAHAMIRTNHRVINRGHASIEDVVDRRPRTTHPTRVGTVVHHCPAGPAQAAHRRTGRRPRPDVLPIPSRHLPAAAHHRQGSTPAISRTLQFEQGKIRNDADNGNPPGAGVCRGLFRKWDAIGARGNAVRMFTIPGAAADFSMPDIARASSTGGLTTRFTIAFVYF